jgi:hypothetical protein
MYLRQMKFNFDGVPFLESNPFGLEFRQIELFEIIVLVGWFYTGWNAFLVILTKIAI